MPEIQPLQTEIGAHSNHDAIATAKIICKPPGSKFAQVWDFGKGQLKRLDLESSKSYVPGIYPAILALRLGRLVQAFSWLERAFDERDGGLVILKSLPSLEFAGFISGLRKLMRRMNFPQSA